MIAAIIIVVIVAAFIITSYINAEEVDPNDETFLK